MTSARTNPRWMSEWISPAACHADRPRRRCHDWAGLSSPAVKKASRSSSPNSPSTTRCRPEAPTPISSRMASASSSSSSDSSASIREEIATAPAPAAAAWSATSAGTASSPSSTLATNSTGLPVSGVRLRCAFGASAGTGTERAGMPALGLLEVGEDQLGLDRLDVGARRDPPVGVDDVLVGVAAHDVQQRVRLADVGQELVAEPLALMRALDQA